MEDLMIPRHEVEGIDLRDSDDEIVQTVDAGVKTVKIIQRTVRTGRH